MKRTIYAQLFFQDADLGEVSFDVWTPEGQYHGLGATIPVLRGLVYADDVQPFGSLEVFSNSAEFALCPPPGFEAEYFKVCPDPETMDVLRKLDQREAT